MAVLRPIAVWWKLLVKQPQLWLLVVALLLLTGLQYRLWFAQGSLAEQKRLEQQLAEQTELNRELRDRNAVIEREVHDLKNGNHGLEQRAREQLGLVKKGEVYYQVVDAPLDPNRAGYKH